MDDEPIIVVDTSVIVGWLDSSRPEHILCTEALEYWAGEDRLAVSSVTYAEMAAGGRTREEVMGRLDATVFQDARGQGATAVETAVHLARKEPCARTVHIPFQLVTRENVQRFLR